MAQCVPLCTHAACGHASTRVVTESSPAGRDRMTSRVLSFALAAPEQCSFGLIDACRHGADEVWFEYFFTRHHARVLDAGSYWRSGRRPKLLEKDEFIAVAKTRRPTYDVLTSHSWGTSLTDVAAALPPDADGHPPPLVDMCLVVPRLNAVRFTGPDDLQCPNVLYRRLNETNWRFDGSRDLPFKARPL